MSICMPFAMKATISKLSFRLGCCKLKKQHDHVLTVSIPSSSWGPLIKKAAQDILDLRNQSLPTLNDIRKTLIREVVYVPSRQVVRYDMKIPKFRAPSNEALAMCPISGSTKSYCVSVVRSQSSVSSSTDAKVQWTLYATLVESCSCASSGFVQVTNWLRTTLW